jgi:hypothetical protein
VKPSTIKAEHLKKLRVLRDEIAERCDFERTERLRKQREEELILDYWARFTRTTYTHRRTGRGAR